MTPQMVYLLPAIVGSVLLVAGGLIASRDSSRGSVLKLYLALGTVFFASPLGAFGTEHFVIPKQIASIVPSWLPARLWIAYFVGTALICAGLSLTFRRCARLAALLTAVMFLSFVSLVHVPGVIAQSGNRVLVLNAFRDSAFGVAAFTLYLRLSREGRGQTRQHLLQLCRIWLGLVVFVFGVAQFMHPEGVPGVPSPRMTPAWVPLPLVFGYVSAMVLVVCGAAMLVGRFARPGAIATASWMLALTFFLYTPDIFILPADKRLLGVNYIFDTMLFGGAMLLLAQALPEPSTSAA